MYLMDISMAVLERPLEQFILEFKEEISKYFVPQIRTHKGKDFLTNHLINLYRF